jgi:hypothetical protein
MHEAGHAVAAVLLGIELKGVDVNRRDYGNGRTALGFTDAPVPNAAIAGQGAVAMPYIIQALAGPIAESAVNPHIDQLSGFDENDRRQAIEITRTAICAKKRLDGNWQVDPVDVELNRGPMERLIRDAHFAAWDLVDTHAETIRDVAKALVQHRRLTGDEVARIVQTRQKTAG